MKYDFTSIMNRHGKDAIAVDSVGQMNGFAPEAPKLIGKTFSARL